MYSQKEEWCIFVHTKIIIKCISFAISIILFINSIIISKTDNFSKIHITNQIENTIISTNTNVIEEIIKSDENENIWQIEIPKIELQAPISEGTTEKVMNEFVGHFEETAIWDGNVGLAAHNRGYPVNYFENLKNLKLEDKIIYIKGNKKRTYKIDKIKIIKDTDWSYLQKTNENRITLITCVENKPEYRLCIQGILEKEEANSKWEKKQKLY